MNPLATAPHPIPALMAIARLAENALAAEESTSDEKGLPARAADPAHSRLHPRDRQTPGR